MKKSKVRGNSLEETILTSLCGCLHVRSRGAHPTSAVVRRAQSRQPATSASLPTNRHARLRLCAVLSVSAAKAGRRGTATAAPSIIPGMRLSAATPFSFLQCSGIFAACCFSHSAGTGFNLGRGCCVFFLPHVASVVAQGAAGLGKHSQRRRICKTASLTARQLAHTSKCSPFDGCARKRCRCRFYCCCCCWWWRRGREMCLVLRRVHFMRKNCNEVLI